MRTRLGRAEMAPSPRYQAAAFERLVGAYSSLHQLIHQVRSQARCG
eukprot:COSAG01_NODE_9635_length_2383_cov_2.828809_3_plen_46_part_00